jgi:hypothetical protein
MKVTVQNGSLHGISRSELEAMVPLFPEAWSNAVNSIVLCQAADPMFRVTYHPKERVAGLHWPASAEVPPTKEEALAELLVSLAVISERRELPRRVSKALRSRFLAETSALRAKCTERLVHHGA